jgi:hypothetical protein
MSEHIPTIAVISNGKVKKQDISNVSYYNIIWDGISLADSIFTNSKNHQLLCIIPPGFDFKDEYILQEFINNSLKYPNSKLFYSDFLNDGISQFLPSVTLELMVYENKFQCPIFLNTINDNLRELLQDKDSNELIWSIIRLFVQHNIIAHHIPEFFFIKNGNSN